MIPKYIEYWFDIIKTMSNQNTYKLAWGRSILEYISTININSNEDDVVIKISDLSDIVLKYYWNQISFFKLIQAPNDNAANIIDVIKEMIELYKEKSNSALPIWYDGGKKVICECIEYKRALNKITTLLKNNPATYFPNASSSNTRKKVALPVYVLVKDKEPHIILKQEDVKCLIEYNDILVRLSNSSV